MSSLRRGDYSFSFHIVALATFPQRFGTELIASRVRGARRLLSLRGPAKSETLAARGAARQKYGNHGLALQTPDTLS
jgi:hypothetical protein